MSDRMEKHGLKIARPLYGFIARDVDSQIAPIAGPQLVVTHQCDLKGA